MHAFSLTFFNYWLRLLLCTNTRSVLPLLTLQCLTRCLQEVVEATQTAVTTHPELRPTFLDVALRLRLDKHQLDDTLNDVIAHFATAEPSDTPAFVQFLLHMCTESNWHNLYSTLRKHSVSPVRKQLASQVQRRHQDANALVVQTILAFSRHQTRMLLHMLQKMKRQQQILESVTAFDLFFWTIAFASKPCRKHVLDLIRIASEKHGIDAEGIYNAFEGNSAALADLFTAVCELIEV